jgi:hypothetical protein
MSTAKSLTKMLWAMADSGFAASRCSVSCGIECHLGYLFVPSAKTEVGNSAIAQINFDQFAPLRSVSPP